MTLWIEQRGLCWICAKPMLRFVGEDNPQSVSRDHLLPKSRGGRNATRNYLLAHRVCNTARGAPKLTLTRAQIQVMKREAIMRLAASPHWVQDYRDHGAFRGVNPPAANVKEQGSRA